MAKTFPVGTVREWEKGQVIKAHDGNALHSGWIALESPEHLRAILRVADTLANQLRSKKSPISGEVYLDHELKEYKREEGEESGPYHPDNFKQYEGFYGAGRYSFFNEFSRRFMARKIGRQEFISNQLLMYNSGERPWNGVTYEGDDRHDVLPVNIKKEIRDLAKQQYVFKGKELNVDEANEIVDLVKKVYAHMEKGLNFEEGEKESYEKAKTLVDRLPMDYVKLGEATDRRNKAVELVNRTFTDNWAVKESFRLHAQQMFNEYLKKFKERIADDLAKDQMDSFGVNLNDEPDVFYKKIYEKLDTDLERIKNFDFDTIVGQRKDIIIEGAYNSEPTYGCVIRRIDDVEELSDSALYGNTGFGEDMADTKYVIEKPAIKGRPKQYETITKSNEIYYKAQFEKMDYPFSELLKLRFATKYQKELEGNWSLNLLPAIEQIEKAMHDLPKGHVLNNSYLNTISQRSYTGGTHGGYAWFDPGSRQINFSDECAKHASIWSRHKISSEFQATMLHEIGHAVSAKFGGDNNIDYKKFTVAAGWSYQQPELRHNMKATGNDKDLVRQGSMASVPLLTKYAHKSQEEAFAEYYSIYNSHKDKIDNWLDNKNVDALKDQKNEIVPKVLEQEKLSKFRQDDMSQELTAKVDDFFLYNKIDPSQHTSIDLISPFRCSISKNAKDQYSPETVRNRKNLDMHIHAPAVSVKDGNEYTVIANSNVHKLATLKKKMMPTVLISKELYSQMKRAKFSDSEIINYVSYQNRDNYVPIQASQPITIEGLRYRNSILDHKQIVKNEQAIRQMRKICRSDALAKAMKTIKFAFDNGEIDDDTYLKSIQQYAELRKAKNV